MTDPIEQPTDPLRRLVASRIREVPDFPQPGIRFRDFSPLLADPDARDALVEHLRARYVGRVDVVAGIESRGFILGAVLAHVLRAPFVPVRKAGKLPPETYRQEYALEYGTATLEVARNAFRPGDRVLIVDDVLATGGTGSAVCTLVERAGGTVVAVDVILELAGLGGRAALEGHRVEALLTA